MLVNLLSFSVILYSSSFSFVMYCSPAKTTCLHLYNLSLFFLYTRAVVCYSTRAKSVYSCLRPLSLLPPSPFTIPCSRAVLLEQLWRRLRSHVYRRTGTLVHAETPPPPIPGWLWLWWDKTQCRSSGVNMMVDNVDQDP